MITHKGVVNRALARNMPLNCKTYWANAPIKPLMKSNGVIGPIAVGLTLRRLVSKVALAAVHVLPAVNKICIHRI